MKDHWLGANLHKCQPSILRRLHVETVGKLTLAVSREREFLFQVLAFTITLFRQKTTAIGFLINV